MKRTITAMASIAVAMTMMTACASTSGTTVSSSAGAGNGWDLKDVLGGSDAGNTIANVLEGVLSKSDLEISDLAGVWTTDGSAVCFQSDNFLKKAGGSAAAGVLESKLDPYYKKFGLVGSDITIDQDGKFSMKVGKLTLSGTVSKNDDKTFNFTFQVMNKINLGAIKTYIQKAGNSMDIMFDATKLKTLLTAIGGVADISMVKTVSGLLDQYDGLCVGFATTKTGSVSTKTTTTTTTTKSSTTTTTTTTEKDDGSDAKSKIGDALRGLMNGSKK